VQALDQNAVKKLGIAGVLIEGMGGVHDYMPPWVRQTRSSKSRPGSRTSLTACHSAARSSPQRRRQSAVLRPSRLQTKRSKKQTSRAIVLLAWNDLGMHCISDGAPNFVILPPANTLEAQLIKRAETPAIVTKGVDAALPRWRKATSTPPRHLAVLETQRKTSLGEALPPDVGLWRARPWRGQLELRKEARAPSSASHDSRSAPYKDDGSYSSLPALHHRGARRQDRQAPRDHARSSRRPSTEMGCRNCHGGGWRKGQARRGHRQPRRRTAILALHDRDHGTKLYAEAKAGKPQFCQKCHGDPAVGMKGDPKRLRLSTSLHAWHANYMHEKGAKACASCHPNDPRGNTQCMRGLHKKRGLDCTHCHGTLAEHAVSLLKAEITKPSAKALLDGIVRTKKFVHVKSVNEIEPRVPWHNEPDCLSCHQRFQKPSKNPTAFNQWSCSKDKLFRNRHDAAGIRCAACHGPPHALYPSENVYQKNRENFQPLSHQGEPYPVGSNNRCDVCHTEAPDAAIHHPNMMRDWRGVTKPAPKRRAQKGASQSASSSLAASSSISASSLSAGDVSANTLRSATWWTCSSFCC
jgi:hypothetical protein